MSTNTRTEQTSTEHLAAEFAELLHLPIDQFRPLPQAERGQPRRIARR